MLAVEVKQYVGEGHQTLVPRVIGRTAAAEDVKQGSGSAMRIVRAWTEAEFLDAVTMTGGPDAVALVRAGLEWNMQHGSGVTFGKGKYGPFYLQAVDATGSAVHRKREYCRRHPGPVRLLVEDPAV